MTVILGFAGLAIDLGASYAKHTELQTGADAAALALAQGFGTDKCKKTGSVTSEATTWVQGNVLNDSGAAHGDPECLAVNRVKVVADATLDHWFMPVVGKSSSDLTADATVEWGKPVAGTTVPLTISACSFEKQVNKPDLNKMVTIWLPKPNGEGEDCDWHDDYPSGGFGVLDNTACKTEIAVPAWEVGSAPGGSGWSNCEDMGPMGQVHLFPIYDAYEKQGQQATYHLKQFAAFELHGIKFQQGSTKTYGDCSDGVPSTPPEWAGKEQNASCIVGKFLKYVELEDVDFEIVAPKSSDTTIIIRLID
ncbi:pilus assembly protein TadG-related protein [Ornithinimicrobium faecis]|uniref:Pilus assembly protein TadG-related protein n=2 Tax=Ornithinimicrobium faecis TaxID=2934158 RepID=A0ABY4YXI6_9MICO|nr:pilus assembly protein TadG-related protein [Ornithinimicrobium sp. HY1793]